MDEQLQKYLMEKYPEKFAQLMQEQESARADSERFTPGVGGHLLSGLRGALEGRSYEDVHAGVEKQAEQNKMNAMRPYEERTKNLQSGFKAGKDSFDFGEDVATAGRNETKFKQEQDTYKITKDKEDRENDPNSQESAIANELANEMGYKGKTLSATQFKAVSPYYKEIYEIKAREKLHREDAAARSADRRIAQQNANTMAGERADNKKAQGNIKLTSDLYKRTQVGELGRLNQMKNQANVALSNISQFEKDPNGYSDYGTLMTSLKSLQGDTSVVKEAEINLGKNATSLINKARNMVQQAIDGQSLQPEQRQQIINVMKGLTEGYNRAYKKAAMPTVITARDNGIPLDQVFDDPEMFADSAPQLETGFGQLSDEELAAKIEAAKAKKGSR